MRKIFFLLTVLFLVFAARISIAQETKTEIKVESIVEPKAEAPKPQAAEDKIVEEIKAEEKTVTEESKAQDDEVKKITKKTHKKIHRKVIVKPVTAIPHEDLLLINLSQSECQNFVSGECFRRDKMRDEPYYHRTRLTIFRGKIFAEQFFQGSDSNLDKLFLTVKDGPYTATTSNDNLISFDVKAGLVSDLKIQKGEVSREKIPESKCNISEALFGFYQVNDASQIISRTALFKDEYNFDGLKEVTFFVEKSNPEEVMVVTKNLNQNPIAVKDIRLCKMPEIAIPQVYFVKHINDEECKLNLHKDVAKCQKYSVCEDFLTVKNCDVVLLRDPMN